VRSFLVIAKTANEDIRSRGQDTTAATAATAQDPGYGEQATIEYDAAYDDSAPPPYEVEEYDDGR
jgi:hypothetical protein